MMAHRGAIGALRAQKGPRPGELAAGRPVEPCVLANQQVNSSPAFSSSRLVNARHASRNSARYIAMLSMSLAPLQLLIHNSAFAHLTLLNEISGATRWPSSLKAALARRESIRT